MSRKPVAAPVAVTITPHGNPARIEFDKRQNLPFLVTAVCPVHGVRCWLDLTGDDYLSRLRIGTFEAILTHDTGDDVCEATRVKLTFNVTLTAEVTP